MGDIADMMLEGDLCAGCGGYIDGEGDGFPRYCSKSCEPNDFRVAHDRVGEDRSRVRCTICNKKVKVEGLHQHMTDKHSHPPVGKLKKETPKSLRDEFAMAALAGMHARDTFDPGQATPEQRANLAYIDADAMLKARES